jgi:hypothetical protein
MTTRQTHLRSRYWYSGAPVSLSPFIHSFIHSFAWNERHINLATGDVVKQNTSLSGSNQWDQSYLPIHNTFSHIASKPLSHLCLDHQNGLLIGYAFLVWPRVLHIQLIFLYSPWGVKTTSALVYSSLCNSVSFCTSTYVCTNNLDTSFWHALNTDSSLRAKWCSLIQIFTNTEAVTKNSSKWTQLHWRVIGPSPYPKT